MLKERDRDILCFIEQSKGITINQCAKIFFNGSYEGARRRLRQLEGDYEKIRSYKLKETGEKVYYLSKKISYHDSICVDYIAELEQLGCNIIDIKYKEQLMEGRIIPDAYVIFSKGKNVYFTLLEVDLYHNTPLSKMQLYEELFNSGEMQNKCYGVFPIIIICKARYDSKLKYNSNNFKVIYTDKEYKELSKYLFN